MRTGRLRTRAFVMGLVAWCALSTAPVAAGSPPLATTFLLLGAALAACATLLFSLRTGAAVAAAAACVFAVVLGLLQIPAHASVDPGALARSLVQGTVALPTMLAIVALAGAVAFAELVSMGLEWDLDLRRDAEGTGGRRRERRWVRVRRRR